MLCRLCHVHCAHACRRLPDWWTIRLPPAAGPYKGGLRFRSGVNLSIIKFLVSHCLHATIPAGKNLRFRSSCTCSPAHQALCWAHLAAPAALKRKP